MRNYTRLQYFTAIAEEGTITAAAERLNITKAVVSKQLQLLEAELGTALVIRNSRHLKLTEQGVAFYEAARAAIAQIEEAYWVAQQGNEVPTGELRVTASLDFGSTYVAEAAAVFSRRHPQVAVDLNFTDARLDPIENRFDIAFRVGWLRDSTNIARKLADFEQYVVAAPSLMDGVDAPLVPADLHRLPFIMNRALGGASRWSFHREGEPAHEVTLSPAIRVDATIGSSTCAMAGGGFAILPDFLVADALRTGRLIRLLPDFRLRRGGIFAVFPPVPFRSAATRQFLHTLETYLHGTLKQSATPAGRGSVC
ncbi:LysR family transcriptional regulator [uncultured Martelella sp.]|uniref:LysR family transcriptional regulator n=1 Tax=uncultured Martelella sp. TaxID=392331 RepID=UPI0029C764CB|nr:LysR family transcriptional regulator [uncultured Martelella sp.]